MRVKVTDALVSYVSREFTNKDLRRARQRLDALAIAILDTFAPAIALAGRCVDARQCVLWMVNPGIRCYVDDVNAGAFSWAQVFWKMPYRPKHRVALEFLARLGGPDTGTVLPRLLPRGIRRIEDGFALQGTRRTVMFGRRGTSIPQKYALIMKARTALLPHHNAANFNDFMRSLNRHLL